MSDFDDDIRARMKALSVLERGEPMSRPRDNRAAADVDIYGVDDLDIADQIAGRHPGDSLARKVSLRNQKWLDLNQRANFTRINPPSVLQGTLGGQQGVSVGDPLQQVAFWGAAEDAETLPVTVTFANVAPPIPAINIIGSAAPLRPFGIVKFGTRGWLAEAEVDIGTGCEFTVSGSQVILLVGLEDTSGPGILPTGMQLSGMLSFYPVCSEAPVTRTRYLDGLSSADTVIVPRFAKSVTAWREAASVALTLDFKDNLGTTRYTVTIAGGTFEFDPIPLSGDIAYVTVTPGAKADIRLVFNLSL